ncbi:MAG TPA: carboxynorspermidine decarboxylase [bacterium]|nr:carboxynorspermidine decarboxylase [bacterium]
MLDDKIIAGLPTPCYVIDEAALIRNLELLASVRADTGCKILLALKAFAAWRLFPLIAQYLDGVNAASVNEARLGLEEFGKEVHLAVPAYGERDLAELFALLAARESRAPFHVVFNSLAQWKKFGKICLDRGIVCGLRVNPERSTGANPIYDPCRSGSRLGITIAEMESCSASYLAGVSGLHFHALCEQNADALAQVLEAFEQKFGKYLPGLKWVNFGGGHHITRLSRLHPGVGITEEYDVELLVKLVREFKTRRPVEVYLEPGEAVALYAGALVATVLDVVRRDVPIAILDASAAAHMPDVLEGPYLPPVLGALPAPPGCPPPPHTFRLSGNTCLAGDVIGDYVFERPLEPGSRVVFLDQAHYTMVKNNTFNGVNLPAIILLKSSGAVETVKEFGFEEFRGRLS